MDKKDVKVLVVEEDPMQRDLIVLAIKRLEWGAICAASALEAVELFQQHLPQVILIDIFLSQKNGLDLFKSLKRHPDFVGTKVIMISALGFPEVVKRAVELGAEDFLVKPLDIDTLTERLRLLHSRPEN
jgi:DNA-binding response OmpR family regulator